MNTSEMTDRAISRPPFLSALCILTFIGSTTAFAGYFLASVFYEKFSQMIITYSSWSSTGNISPMYFTLLMVLYSVSLTGAIRMWKLHRDGFIFYTIAQTAIMLTPVLWIDIQAFSYTNAIFTIIFIAGYAMNLRHMKKQRA